jgi:hypothetical protein
MSDVFQNIDPLTARRVCPPRLWCGGEETVAGWRGGGGGGGVNILEDARHCSVLYIHKFFVLGVYHRLNWSSCWAPLLAFPPLAPLTGEPERCGDWLWSSRRGYSQTLFFPALILTKYLVFSPERLGFLHSHQSYSQSLLRKPCVLSLRIFFCLIFVWFQKIKQVFSSVSLCSVWLTRWTYYFTSFSICAERTAWAAQQHWLKLHW